ncbi:MAG: trimeric intracellular cation channel family protein [Parashewanella sp.]
MSQWIYFFDLWGTAVFALTGALAAGHHKMDPFGVLVLAGVTAVGGGSIRDALMGATPVFWLQDPNYVLVILCTVALTLVFTRLNHNAPWYILPIADALGLALFTIIGTEKALLLGLSEVSAVIMGVVTGIGGGIMRDVLCRQVPMVLRTEIYATACIVGGICYCMCLNFYLDEKSTLVISMSVALAIRLAAIKWRLSLPAFDLKR